MTPLEKMRARVMMVRYLLVLDQSGDSSQENISLDISRYLKSVMVREKATRSTSRSRLMKNSQGMPALL